MFKKEIILTEEQQEAIDLCINFIKYGNHNEWFTIEGRAGTGKSTIIRKVLGKFRQKSIIISALSHKAKKVIYDSVKQDNISCKALTIAGMLGMTLEQETGKFIKDYFSKKKPPISLCDIIVVDEASMVNEEALKLIFELKTYGAKVIFLGDIGQLEPIREDTNTNQPSPIFKTNNKATLTKRIRQSENHPVLHYADFFWENSQIDFPKENPVPSNERKNKEVDNNKLLFYNNINELLPLIEEKFKKSVVENNPNIIKIVTYRNIVRKSYNKYFHEVLFKNKETGLVKQFNVGELIIFNDNYEKDNIVIDNSSEFQIKRVLSSNVDINDISLKYYKLEVDILYVSDEKISVFIDVLAEESIDEYNKYISSLFQKAKNLPEKTNQRKKALNEAWAAKKKFANIDYAYAITSHKCQGSTYKSVVVDETDILSVNLISNATKSRSIYTALTRANNEVFIV
jgi:exodeoxyribonuclease-5